MELGHSAVFLLNQNSSILLICDISSCRRVSGRSGLRSLCVFSKSHISPAPEVPFPSLNPGEAAYKCF